MNNRITISDLEIVCARINKVTNSPAESYTKSAEGKYTSNPNNYHLSGAYGGYNLHRMCNEGGGINNVFSCGHIPKRELYDRMQAYLNGLTERVK